MNSFVTHNDQNINWQKQVMYDIDNNNNSLQKRKMIKIMRNNHYHCNSIHKRIHCYIMKATKKQILPHYVLTTFYAARSTSNVHKHVPPD